MHRSIVAMVLVIGLVGPSNALAESDDSPAGAGGPIQSGGLYYGTIDTENDVDWWVFYSGSDTQIDVALTGLGPDSCFGPVMYLKDANGQILAGSGYPANEFEIKHILYTVGLGTFYVEVFPYNVAPCIGPDADYRLWINSSPLLLAGPPYVPPPPAPAPAVTKPDRSAIRAAAECSRARTRVSNLRKKLRRARGVNYRNAVRAELRQARAVVARRC